jgi:hypothetical protein
MERGIRLTSRSGILTVLSVLGLDMDIKATAAIELAPKGNQIAVNIIFVIAAVFFGASVWLDFLGKNWILAGAVGLAFLVVGGGFWWKSHKNESLQKAHPFTMKVGEGDNSVEVSADARSLPALDYLKGILGQYSAIFHRERLPEPSGTVDANGHPIEGTFEKARSLVQAANDIAQRQADSIAEDICSRANSAASSSPVLADILDSDAPNAERTDI